MRNHTHFEVAAVAWGLLVGLLAVPRSGRAQIVALTNEHGCTIYVNATVPELRGARRDVPGQGKLSEAANTAFLPFDRLVRQTSERAQIDSQLVHAVIQAESEYNPRAYSRKGAMGLMQLVPSTARRLGVRDPFDPEQNITGGVAHLKRLLALFGGDVPISLAAYNAGEHAVLQAKGIPPFAETRDYVQRVIELYRKANENAGDTRPTLSYPPPIHKYVDARGVTHFTQ